MNKRGFTLVELLATIVIIAMIMGIVLPSAMRVSKENEGKMCESYEDMMEEYAAISPLRNNYFIDLDELDELDVVKKDCDGYVFVDHTVSPMQYKAYLLCSNGCSSEGYNPEIRYEKEHISVPVCLANVIYNGHEQTLVATSNKYILTNNMRKDIGEQNVKVAISEKRLYSWMDDSQDSKMVRKCKILPREIKIKANVPDFIYLDSVPTFGYTLIDGPTGGNPITITGENPLVNPNDIEYTVYNSAGDKVTLTSSSPAGKYTVKAYSKVKDNYTLTQVTSEFTIFNRPIAFPECPSKVFDGTNITLFAAHSSEYTNSAIKGTNVNVYEGMLTPNANYEWSDGDNRTAGRKLYCEITKKDLTITAQDQTITYGNEITKTVSKITSSGLVSGDSITQITLTPSRTNVGEGIITPSGATTSKGIDNYIVKYVDGKLTINRAKTATTGSCANPEYTGSSVTLASGGNFVDYTNNTATTVGTSNYKVTVTADSNHAFSDGQLSKTLECNVAKKSLTITAKDQTITYGESISNTVSDITATGLVSGDSITKITLTTSRTDAGEGKITPSAASTTNGLSNYNYKYVDGKLTINRAKTATTGSCNSNTYDGKEKTLASGGSFVTYSSNNKQTNVGSTDYQITVTADNNHAFSDGNLTKTLSCNIAKAESTCPTLTQYSKAYDGKSHGITVGTGTAGGSLQYTTSSTGTYTSTVPSRTNAGTTTVYVKVKGDGNHNDKACGNKAITISKVALTVTAENKEIKQGSSAPTYSYTASGFVNNETKSVLTGTAKYTIKSGSTVINDVSKAAVGDYTITPSGLDATNYTISYKDGKLTIKPNTPASISCSDQVYTGGNLSGCKCTGGTLTGDVTKVSVGTYSVGCTPDSDHSAPSPSSVTWKITRKPVAPPSCTNATYDTYSHVLLAAHTSGGYTNPILEAIDAGDSYSVTLTLNPNYKWSSGSDVESNRSLICSISKAQGSVSVTSWTAPSKYGFKSFNWSTSNTNMFPIIQVDQTYIYGEGMVAKYGYAKTFNGTVSATGTVSCSSSNPSVATCSVSSNTITIEGKNAGSTTITVTSGQTNNYTAATVNYNSNTPSSVFYCGCVCSNGNKFGITSGGVPVSGSSCSSTGPYNLGCQAMCQGSDSSGCFPGSSGTNNPYIHGNGICAQNGGTYAGGGLVSGTGTVVNW